MSDRRVFSDAELTLMAMPLVDRISDAIDNGEYDTAKSLARQLEQECVPMIHTFEEFVTALLSFTYREHGTDGIEKGLRYAANVLMKPMHETLAALDFRSRVEVFAAFFRAHSGPGLRLEEDDEKVTLILNPCGSGGRMVREGYFAPPKNLLRVRGALSITFGREDFPSYCTHCAVFHHLMPIEWAGQPFPPIDIGPGPGDPCKWHIYKDPAAIPARYHEQVGQLKPPTQ